MQTRIRFSKRRKTSKKNLYIIKRYRNTQHGGIFNLIAWIRKKFTASKSPETQSSSVPLPKPPSDSFIKRWYQNFLKLFRKETGNNPTKAETTQAVEEAIIQGSFQNASFPIPSKDTLHLNETRKVKKSLNQRERLEELSRILNLDNETVKAHFQIDDLRLLLYKEVLNFVLHKIETRANAMSQTDRDVKIVLADLSFHENPVKKESKTFFFYWLASGGKNVALDTYLISKLQQQGHNDFSGFFIAIPTLFDNDQQIYLLTDLSYLISIPQVSFITVNEETESIYGKIKSDFLQKTHRK
jgi:hypothetical protein